MLRKLVIASLLAASLMVAGCRHGKVQNPIANIDSKQPDKVLFDRAMISMNKARYTEARTLLDTLIQTYPESEYVARAKLSLGDAWYKEGGTAGLQEAEVQYKDFITFFPNMPEAAEAQFKVANIHYNQMEKPDRDFTQAMRAADEYKTMITQFPDSKLVPQAKQRLREVQEVLAERQFRIARFYFMRNNLAASQARLTSLVDSYPLYSQADEAMFMLGSIYEKQAFGLHSLRIKLPDAQKERLAATYEQKAIEAYSRLITRYPVTLRADDARKRLQALKAPVPTPTPEAIAQNQAEEDSRGNFTRFHELEGNFKKHPDVSRSAEVGEPTMAEEEIDSAPALIQQFNNEVKEAAAATPGTGPVPGANAPPPSSNNPPAPASQPASQPAASNTPTQPAPAPAASEPAADSKSDLPMINSNNAASKTSAAPAAPATTAAASNTPTPAATSAVSDAPAALPAGNAPVPPKQVNEIGVTADSQPQGSTTQAAQNGQQQNNPDQDSSSKKKKKKGLRKLIPF